MGYFDCFCVPSVSSAPPTPENPNPASSRHCTSPSFLASSGTKGKWLMVDYVGQSTTANYTLLDGDGWVGLIMSETVNIQSQMKTRRADESTLQPDNSSSNGGSSEMARRDIILLLVFNTKILRWRISVISKNSDKSYVSCSSIQEEKEEEVTNCRYHQILIFGPTSSPIPINSAVYLVKELLPNKYWYKMLLGTTTSLLVIRTSKNRASLQTRWKVLITGRITLQNTNGPISMARLPPSHSRRDC
jgi:hypothetical protein